jgi:hypothetical protein
MPVSPVNRNHPLVGTWKEIENPVHTSTVMFKIEVTNGRFYVRGVDEDNGVVLRISKTTWDGERLRFVSLYPPTKHKATNEFLLTGKGRARHTISYSDEDGDCTVNEEWSKTT